jgi:serine/threonine-protein kinase
VITTNPPPNSSIAVGQSVTLIISSGPPHTVPNVVGDQLPQAEAALQAAGLNFTVHYVSGPASKAGTVLSQNPPAGAQEPANFAVTLNVVQQPPNSSTTTTSSSVPPPTSGGQN